MKRGMDKRKTERCEACRKRFDPEQMNYTHDVDLCRKCAGILDREAQKESSREVKRLIDGVGEQA